MSTLRVSAINNPSASSGGLAISSAGLVTGAGLDLIVTQSFSAASSVSLNNCFSAVYDNYQVVVQCTASTATAMSIRLRVSGADNSTSSYIINGVYQAGSGSPLAYRSGVTTSFIIAQLGTVDNAMSADIYAPFATRRTNITAASFGDNFYVGDSGLFDATTSFDGCTLYPGSGTITGTVSVYGYRK